MNFADIDWPDQMLAMIKPLAQQPSVIAEGSLWRNNINHRRCRVVSVDEINGKVWVTFTDFSNHPFDIARFKRLYTCIK